MQRLVQCIFLLSALTMVGCNKKEVCDEYDSKDRVVDLQTLLNLHDREVDAHGKDLCYMQDIGSFGRQGVHAAYDHLIETETSLNSYAGIHLIFGVAEEARAQTGYDICNDESLINKMNDSVDASLKTLERVCR